jgi:hypothetical protein
MSIFLPSPLVGEGGASRSEATGEGFVRLGELCENVLQNGGRLLQYVIVPVADGSKAVYRKDRVSRYVALGRCVLATIDFDDEALLEANEVENKVTKGDLATKLEKRKPSISEQSPRGGFGVGWPAAHLLREIADALGGGSMVRRLRHEPLTRRLTSFGATLSHRGRGFHRHTRIGIST